MLTSVATADLPTWDLTSVYPALDSPERLADTAEFVRSMDALAALLAEAEAMADTAGPKVVGVFDAMAGLSNRASELSKKLDHYLFCLVTEDSRNEPAQAVTSELFSLEARRKVLETRLTAWIGRIDVDSLIDRSSIARDDAFLVRKRHTEAAHLMHPLEEDLAAELNLAGGRAWEQMYGNLESQVMATLEHADGTRETLPINDLERYFLSPDNDVRRRALEASDAAWKQWETPIAAALNGVKGFQATVARRQHWPSVLEQTLAQNHMDRQALDTMLECARNAFPDLHRFMRAKARLLGKDRVQAWDFWAPVTSAPLAWSWDESVAFVCEQFGAYSSDLRSLADQAIAERWIDVGPRENKGGGAFSTSVGNGNSRILMNFVPGYTWTSTLAHELGHAYHTRCQAARSPWQRAAHPMTLAESASIFCETVVRKAAMAHVTEDERLEILASYLSDTQGMIGGVFAAFHFEQEVLVRRAERNLAPGEMCDIAMAARQDVYQGELDDIERFRHGWAGTIHYFLSDLPFYNYPYMFGVLFSTGLYARYEQDPDAFRGRFEQYLASTGETDAATLALRFGFDIRQPAFWEDSFSVIRADIDTFVDLVDRRLGAA